MKDVHVENAELAEDLYDVVLARSVKIKARDGIDLSLDIYRPARDGAALPGPFPAVITRSPYDTRSGKGPSGQAKNGEYFAAGGISTSCKTRGAVSSRVVTTSCSASMRAPMAMT